MASEVLVIDDEASLARNIKEYLEADGVAALVCGDGESGLAEFARRPAAVVVLDLKLPGMDGLAVLGCLLASAPDVKVILITAHGTAETGAAALAAGAYRFMPKPLALSELGHVVGQALAEAGRAWPTAH